MWPFKKKKSYNFRTFTYDERIVPIKDFKSFTIAEDSNEPFGNFAMMIPTKPFKPIPEPKPTRWDKLICKVFGHKWRKVMITTFDARLPEKCIRCYKKK